MLKPKNYALCYVWIIRITFRLEWNDSVQKLNIKISTIRVLMFVLIARISIKIK